MKVIVDTSVWSLALRRGTGESLAPVQEFRHLIRDHRVQMIGPIRQEIPVGYSQRNSVDKAEETPREFPRSSDSYRGVCCGSTVFQPLPFSGGAGLKH